jgi:hypothetical protein
MKVNIAVFPSFKKIFEWLSCESLTPGKSFLIASAKIAYNACTAEPESANGGSRVTSAFAATELPAIENRLNEMIEKSFFSIRS